MKKITLLYLLMVSILLVSLLSACAPPTTEPYVPLAVGTTFTYDVSIGESPPLEYREILWPTGESGRLIEVRGYLSRQVIDGPAKGSLILRVKKEVKKFGCLLNSGFEIEVVDDSLNLYGDTAQILWDPIDEDINEVLVFSANSMLAPTEPWGMPLLEDGCSVKPYFFPTTEGMTERSITFKSDSPETPNDRTQNLGFDKSIPGYEGTKLMHFKRIVLPGTVGNSDYIDKGFYTDFWFAPGKGLVRLEQWVDNTLTMTWIRK